MNLPANPFARALKSRDKQIGLWISLASNIAAEVTAHAGFDWALIDMEHAPNDYRSVLGQLQVFAGSDTTALVRVEWNNTVAVKKLLDIGAQGLLFPMIQSVEEARRAVAATRYPPKGVRGVSGTTRATRYGRVKDYLARVEEGRRSCCRSKPRPRWTRRKISPRSMVLTASSSDLPISAPIWASWATRCTPISGPVSAPSQRR